jgi:hypothetical protein
VLSDFGNEGRKNYLSGIFRFSCERFLFRKRDSCFSDKPASVVATQKAFSTRKNSPRIDEWPAQFLANRLGELEIASSMDGSGY